MSEAYGADPDRTTVGAGENDRTVVTPTSVPPKPGDSGAMLARSNSGRLSPDLPPEVRAAFEDATKRVHRYALMGELGRGGMGIVYRAYDTALRRPVALKMILDPARAGPEQIARFQIEASAAGRLHHEGIVAVHEVGEHEGRPFLVMDLIEGESFEALLRKGGLEARAAVAIVRDVARALAHAHAAGVVHRDVKPENVLIDRQGKPHLTDFGLAREVASSERLTVTGQVLGTPVYMPPEQAGGETSEQGPWSDVYSLGGVLYRALVGRPPLEAPTVQMLLKKILLDEPVPPRKQDPRIAVDLETIVLRCLAKEPPRRYPDAAKVADELDRFLAGTPIVARPVGFVERGAVWARRNPALAACVATIVFVVATASAAGASLLQKEHRAEQGLRDVKRDRHASQECMRAAELCQRARDLAGAIAALDSAVALDPENAAAFQQRGSLRLKKKDTAGALADETRAVELDPFDVFAWKMRSDVRVVAGDLPGAIADLGKALELEPKNTGFVLDRARLRAKAGDRAGALVDVRAVRAADPQDPIADALEKELAPP